MLAHNPRLYDGMTVEGMWFISSDDVPSSRCSVGDTAWEFGLSSQATEWVAVAALLAGCFLWSQYCAYSGHSREAARLFAGNSTNAADSIQDAAEPSSMSARLVKVGSLQ